MNSPILRFKDDSGFDFPEWKSTKLNEFLIPHFRETEKPQEKYLSIGVRSHCRGTFQKPDEDPNKNSMDKLYVVHEGDLILSITFAWEGAIAIAKSADHGGYVSHRFPTYRFKSEFTSAEFFQYMFVQPEFRATLELISPGGAGRNRVLSKNEFLKISCKLPTKNEQTKIANFLTAVDTKITQLTQKCDLLTQYKKEIMLQIFNQELRFKDDDGQDFPEWQEHKISELFHRSTHVSKTEHITNDGQFIIVDMGSISKEAKLLGTKRTNYTQDFLTTNDLIMAKDDIGGGHIIGRVVLIPEDNKYICGDHVYKLTIKHGYIQYLYYAINSYKVNRSFRKKANGTAQIGISNKTVDDQLVPTPCIKEQIKIANFLTAIDDKLTHTQNQLAAAKQYKQGLLQQMFV